MGALFTMLQKVVLKILLTENHIIVTKITLLNQPKDILTGKDKTNKKDNEKARKNMENIKKNVKSKMKNRKKQKKLLKRTKLQ